MFQEDTAGFLKFVLLSAPFVMFFAGYLLRWHFARKNLRQAEAQAKDLLNAANKEVESLRREAEIQSKDLMLKLRQDFERETKSHREEMAAVEKG